MKVLIGLLLFSLAGFAGTSALFNRGYTVLPEPQQVSLRSGDFAFGANWRVERGAGAAADSMALKSLTDELDARHHIKLNGAAGAPTVLLEIRAGGVQTANAQDQNHTALATQAYRIELSPSRIHLLANAEPGLFYAVQTLLQMLSAPGASMRLPEAEITDWPDLEMRQIYWDDAHHLEHLSDLKAAVKQASYFKINGFILKLEGHFQYRSAPALVEPQALTPAELQDLTDYALRYHVQVIPYLDAPAHIAFILKHPEYAKLRSFPESNYELCATNPASLKLMYGMYDDLLAANKGVKYFYLSTDEAYYVGWAHNAQCDETTRTKELGSRGKLLAEFVTSVANYLHDRGRTVVFWGEYPLKPEDIDSLPPHLVNGETYGEKFDPFFKRRGIRQMIYNSTEGEEQMFPQYYLAPATGRIHPLHESEQRVADAMQKIAADPGRRTADLIGLVIAGWGDMGLHPETFWLGYAAITAAGWNPSADAQQAMSAFYPLFYGPGVINMDRVYQLLSYQAQTWTDTWERMNSTMRKPIWGNSDKIFTPALPAHDATLALPAVPGANLHRGGNWAASNARRVQIAADAMAQNDELTGLLRSNLLRADANRYNLEVLLSIARLCRQNLSMLGSLQSIDSALAEADKSATVGHVPEALASVDRALDEAVHIRGERNDALADAVSTWSQTWLPRVEQANGRRFLHEVDDVKDHLPDRTVDMSYLVYRELLLPFENWYQAAQTARNDYARAHSLPARDTPLNWSKLQKGQEALLH
jgi:hexosaminidase